jgi:cytochrome b
MMKSKILVWDLPVRIFHWSLVMTFAGAYLLGDSERWRSFHVALGYGVLGLIAFRIVWGFIGTRYARFQSFAFSPMAAWRYLKDLAGPRSQRHVGHNPAGSWAIFGLLGLGLATGMSGWLRYEEIGGESLEEVHEVLANLWLGLVVFHVIAAIVSGVLHRENLVRAMVTGYKEGPPELAASKSSPVVGLGLVVALVVGIAAWVGWAGPQSAGNRSADAASAHGGVAPARDKDED